MHLYSASSLHCASVSVPCGSTAHCWPCGAPALHLYKVFGFTMQSLSTPPIFAIGFTKGLLGSMGGCAKVGPPHAELAQPQPQPPSKGGPELSLPLHSVHELPVVALQNSPRLVQCVEYLQLPPKVGSHVHVLFFAAQSKPPTTLPPQGYRHSNALSAFKQKLLVYPAATSPSIGTTVMMSFMAGGRLRKDGASLLEDMI